MLASVARAAQALAIWRYLESSSAKGDANPAELKAHTAQAFQSFVEAAYVVAFDLAPYLITHVEEITTKNETRYSATTAGGGLVLQKMNLGPENRGTFLVTGSLFSEQTTENWLQLMIDLPELLEILGVK